ncbi:hypothetical protein C8R46DRAFT_1114780 [Mycena filopes]|nr:hypothetical protein C8R46DRAFT_1114780 [Mycena filopes]
MDRLPAIAAQILEANNADAAMGSPCPCGRKEPISVDEGETETGGEVSICEVQCHNCTQYAASCKTCFIEAHRNNPFHWAKVWDAALGIFRRHNLSALGHHLQLGHHGKACLNPLAAIGVFLHLAQPHGWRIICVGSS